MIYDIHVKQASEIDLLKKSFTEHTAVAQAPHAHQLGVSSSLIGWGCSDITAACMQMSMTFYLVFNKLINI